MNSGTNRAMRRRLLAVVCAAALPLPGRFAFAADLPQSFDPKRDAARDLETARDIARTTGRRILVDVGGEWCSWCHTLDRFFADNAELKRLRDNWYVFLKINWSPQNTNAALLGRWPKIHGYPHFFVLEPDGRLIHSQDTAALESGSSYNAAAVRTFLVRWAPGSRPSA